MKHASNIYLMTYFSVHAFTLPLFFQQLLTIEQEVILEGHLASTYVNRLI